jgi:hypothetical protein
MAVRCPHAVRGMTCSDYEEMVAHKGEICWLCLRTEEEVMLDSAWTKIWGTRQIYEGFPVFSLVIDHDHALGRTAVRGLLCAACNLTIDRRPDHPRWEPEVVREYLQNPWHSRPRAA